MRKKKKKKSCLEALEEIKGLVENQPNEPEDVNEVPTTGQSDPPEEPLPQPEGRKLYISRSGEKYHFDTTCKGFNGQPNFEKNPCPQCQQRSQQILEAIILHRGGASSSRAPNNELGFEDDGSSYHEANCVAFRRYKAKDKRTVCYYCLNDERLLQHARNR